MNTYQPARDSELVQFLGTYLCQGWTDIHGGAWEAVEAYVASEPLENRRAARAELADVLALNLSEQEFSLAMDRVGMDYHPPGVGGTYRGFLENVERYLREHEA